MALVTGAGRGLGRAYALLLAARGAHVVVHDAGVDPEGLGGDRSVADGVVAEIQHGGGQAEAAYHDLAAAGSASALVADISDRHGRLDVIVHSVGVAIRATLPETDDEALDRILAINGRAAVELVRAAFPVMAHRRYGRIVLTVSGHGLYPGDDANLVAYGVSKAMQFGLMNAVAGPFAASGILVNAVSPVAATRMLSRNVAPGTLRPEDVAPGVVYLASDRIRRSGIVLRAAGGRFSIGRYAVSRGVDLTNDAGIEPEAVAEAWGEIAGGELGDPNR